MNNKLIAQETITVDGKQVKRPIEINKDKQQELTALINVVNKAFGDVINDLTNFTIIHDGIELKMNQLEP